MNRRWYGINVCIILVGCIISGNAENANGEVLCDDK